MLSLIATILINSSYASADAQTSSGTESANNNFPATDLNGLNNDTNNQNESNKWINVSGYWSLGDAGLHGGSTNGSISLASNVILNPMIPNTNFNLSTSLKVNEVNESEANYAGLIYSFVNPQTYKYAALNIYNQSIYVIFYDVSNDTVITDPNWPGIKTNLTWEPGRVFDMVLENNGTDLNLKVNGTNYYSKPIGNEESLFGYVGVQYGRVTNIDFMNFQIQTLDQQAEGIDTSGRGPPTFSVSDSVSILLEDESFPSGSYIHLYDTTPYVIMNGHIAAKLPCDDLNTSDVSILTGQAPSLFPIELEFISPLSQSGDLCLYHGDLKSSHDSPISDIVLSNNSTDEIEFPDTSSVVISVVEMARR